MLYCRKQIDQLLSKCNIIDLVEHNRPIGLIKVIIKRYGIELNPLLQLSGADLIRLNRKNKALVVIGNKRSFKAVINHIELCCNSLDVSKENLDDHVAVNECAACFCQVDSDHYRLQYCGHLYCQECITNQMDNAIKSVSFPLNCANCNQEFVIEDLERILLRSPQPRLFDVLLTEFIRRHPTEWHFCPTPECESVYKRSASYEVFTCHQCQKKTCRGCHTDDHPGYDCNEIKLVRDPDASLEKFLNENPHSVKKCPGCSAVIEKKHGCHHIKCSICYTHFCWLCLTELQTSGECYRHLQEVHGGFYAPG